MELYVDDFFGGPIKGNDHNENDRSRAELLFNVLIAVGELTGTKMNRKKCHGPATIMEILGFVYDAIARSCRLSLQKAKKYIDRIIAVLRSPRVKFKNLEKLVGNLTYAA